jgi:hypothetical protein
VKTPATAALGGALLLGMVAAGWLAARDYAAAVILADLESRFDADLAFRSIGVGGLSALPLLRVDFEGLTLLQHGALNGLELARIERMGLTVDLSSLLSQGDLTVRALDIEEGVVKLVVDEAGHPSWGRDPAAPLPARALAFDLERLQIRDLDLRYENRRLVTRLDLSALSLMAQAQGGVLHSRAEIGSLRLVEGREAFIDGAPVVLDLDLRAEGASWRLGPRRLFIGGQPMDLEGSAWRPQPDADLELDLRLDGPGLALSLGGTVQRPRVHQGLSRP